jgi:hypothetical protein
MTNPKEGVMDREAAAREYAGLHAIAENDINPIAHMSSYLRTEKAFLAGDANAVKRLIARIRARDKRHEIYEHEFSDMADWLEAQENQTNEEK